jgi:hypothetical protein
VVSGLHRNQQGLVLIRRTGALWGNGRLLYVETEEEQDALLEIAPAELKP